MDGKVVCWKWSSGANFHFFFPNSKVNFTGFIKFITAPSSAKYKQLQFDAAAQVNPIFIF